MNIIIKTMTNLPEYCYDCPCNDTEWGYCQADKEHRYSSYRPFWCPLEKLREHTTWIPVNEMLQEEGKTVIASTEYGVYSETKYTQKYGWEWLYDAGSDYWKSLEGVQAWMPLPKKYKPESEVNYGKHDA